MSCLPYGRQSISEEDIAAVVAALRSDFLTQGPLIEAFEQRFAARVGARHAIAVNCATAALHLALRVADLGPGDRVVTSPITFVASANCAAYVGATPTFADVEAARPTLDPAAVAATWHPATRAVIGVDYAGYACDWPGLAAVARARGALLIADSCHAVGGAFHAGGARHTIGSHPWADFTTFSFHPVKTMTTGEGGMLVTDRDDLAHRARLLRSHGISRDPATWSDPASGPDLLQERGPWFYEMQELGWNYRLTDLQCALGLGQLDRLDTFLARRRAIVATYDAALADLPWLRRPSLRDPADAATASWHLYPVLLEWRALGRTRTEVMHALRAAGVGSQVLYIPVHLQPWYRRTYGYGPGLCPRAEAYYAAHLCLPLFPALGEEDAQRVIAAVRALAP